MNKFHYKALDRARDEIRLLRLIPSEDNASIITCDLVHVSLHECPNYEALSYTWGLPNFSCGILVNGEAFPVTENLLLALHALRSETSARCLWIDAICINQQDIAERNHEVLRIMEIYEHATSVVVWLGPASDDSGLAYDHLEDLSNQWHDLISKRWYNRISKTSIIQNSIWLVFITILTLIFVFNVFWIAIYRKYVRTFCVIHMLYYARRTENALIRWALTGTIIHFFCICAYEAIKPMKREYERDVMLSRPQPPARELIDSLYHLFNRDWFTRTWIVQEISAAKTAKIQCGQRMLELKKLVDAVSMMEFIINNDVDASPYINCGFQELTGLMEGCKNPALPERPRLHRFSLLELITHFSHHNTTDPRDKVFGLLGMSNEGRKLLRMSQANLTHSFKPDYSRSTQETYAQAVKFIIESSNDLNVFRACLYQGSVSNLPSWVPDWTVKKVRSVSGWRNYQKPFTITGQNGEKFGNQVAVATFSDDLKRIGVRGFIVGHLSSFLLDAAIGDNDTRVNSVLPKFGQQGLYGNKLTAENIWAPTWSLWVKVSNILMFSLIHLPFRRFICRWLERKDIMDTGAHIAWISDIIDIKAAERSPNMRVPKNWKAFASRMRRSKSKDEGTRVYCFETETNPGFNLGPTLVSPEGLTTYALDAVVGDKIAMMVGAKVPVVIRSAKQSNEEKETFRLIGPGTFGMPNRDQVIWRAAQEAYFKQELELREFEIV